MLPLSFRPLQTRAGNWLLATVTLECAIRISLLLWVPSFRHHDVDGMKSSYGFGCSGTVGSGTVEG